MPFIDSKISVPVSPEKKEEFLEWINRRFGRCPAVLHPGKEKLNLMVDLIKNW